MVAPRPAAVVAQAGRTPEESCMNVAALATTFIQGRDKGPSGTRSAPKTPVATLVALGRDSDEGLSRWAPGTGEAAPFAGLGGDSGDAWRRGAGGDPLRARPTVHFGWS